MKVLGISGSPRKEGASGTYKLVKTVLENTGCEYELVSLRGKKISGCIACLGCAKDNICKLKDDLEPLREKIVEADALVIGGPNYFSTLNALTHAFFERWFQFRHQAGSTMWGKLAVAVGVGGTQGKAPADEIEKMCMINFIETVAKVQGMGAAACYSCGFGETCEVGIQTFHHSQGLTYTDDNPPDVEKQPDVMKAAADAGKLLGHRLGDGHDRAKVTNDVKEKLMAEFGMIE